jgi:hypothetical protein
VFSFALGNGHWTLHVQRNRTVDWTGLSSEALGDSLDVVTMGQLSAELMSPTSIITAEWIPESPCLRHSLRCHPGFQKQFRLSPSEELTAPLQIGRSLFLIGGPSVIGGKWSAHFLRFASSESKNAAP